MSGGLKYADVRVDLTVAFEDDGVSCLKDQAIDAAADVVGVLAFDFNEAFRGAEVIGEVRNTEFPEQKS